MNDHRGGVLGARGSEIWSLVRSWAQVVLLTVKRVQITWQPQKKDSGYKVSQNDNIRYWPRRPGIVHSKAVIPPINPPKLVYHTNALQSFLTRKSSKKLGHSRPIFLYFRLFNTVESKCFPMTGFKPQTSGIGSDRSTNWDTTTAQYTWLENSVYNPRLFVR